MNVKKEVQNTIRMFQMGQIQLSEALFHIAEMAKREENTILAEPENTRAPKRLDAIQKAIGI